MTIAVTAASGQLGREIVHAVKRLAPGNPVVGLARTPSKAEDLNIEVRRGDYERPDDLASSLVGVTSLALVSGTAHPEERIQQHRNVIRAASEAGVKRIVFTSVQGDENSAFGPILRSMRQTEADIRESGMAWAVGRNGIYIEPDVEAMDDYRRLGEVANCAGGGRCGYVSRAELGLAYAHLLTDPRLEGDVHLLHGSPLSQEELVDHLNRAFGTELPYRSMGVEEYLEDRCAALGDFFGPIIAGIYGGIRSGAHDAPSDFERVTGRPHRDWNEYFAALGH